MACIPVYKGKKFSSTEQLVKFLSTEEGIMAHLADGKDVEFANAIDDIMNQLEQAEPATQPTPESIFTYDKDGNITEGQIISKGKTTSSVLINGKQTVRSNQEIFETKEDAQKRIDAEQNENQPSNPNPKPDKGGSKSQSKSGTLPPSKPTGSNRGGEKGQSEGPIVEIKEAETEHDKAAKNIFRETKETIDSKIKNVQAKIRQAIKVYSEKYGTKKGYEGEEFGNQSEKEIDIPNFSYSDPRWNDGTDLEYQKDFNEYQRIRRDAIKLHDLKDLIELKDQIQYKEDNDLRQRLGSLVFGFHQSSDIQKQLKAYEASLIINELEKTGPIDGEDIIRTYEQSDADKGQIQQFRNNIGEITEIIEANKPKKRLGKPTSSTQELSTNPIDWVREYLKSPRRIDINDVAKQTGMTVDEANKQNVGKLAKANAISVERAAEEITRLAEEQSGIKLDELEVKNALLEALQSGRKATPVAKQQEANAESAFPVVNQEGTPPVIRSLPGLSPTENQTLAKFLYERIPDLLKEGGKVALLNLQQGVNFEALKYFHPEIAAKVAKIDIKEWAKVNSGGKQIKLVHYASDSYRPNYEGTVSFFKTEDVDPNAETKEGWEEKSKEIVELNIPESKIYTEGDKEIDELLKRSPDFQFDTRKPKDKWIKVDKQIYDTLLAKGYLGFSYPKGHPFANEVVILNRSDVAKYGGRAAKVNTAPKVSDYLPPNQLNDIGTVIAAAFKYAKDYIAYHGKNSQNKGIKELYDYLKGKVQNAAQIARNAFNRAMNKPFKTRESFITDPTLKRQAEMGGSITPQRFQTDSVLSKKYAALKSSINQLKRRYPLLNAKTFASAIDLIQGGRSKSETIGIKKAKSLMDSYLKTLKSEKDKQLFYDYVLLADMVTQADGDLFDKANDKEFYTTFDGSPISKQTVRDQFAQIKALVDANPLVKNAIEERRKVFKQILEGAVNRGFMAKSVLENDPGTYFHHMVLSFDAAKKIIRGVGGNVAQAISSPFVGSQVRRKKTSTSYSPNVVLSDFVTLKEQIAQQEAFDNISLPLKNLYLPVVVQTTKDAQKEYENRVLIMIGNNATQAEIDKYEADKDMHVKKIFTEMMLANGYVPMDVPASAKYSVSQQTVQSGIYDRVAKDISQVFADPSLSQAERDAIYNAVKSFITGYKGPEIMWMPKPLADTMLEESTENIKSANPGLRRRLTSLYKATKLTSILGALPFFTQNLASNTFGYLMDKNYAKLGTSSFLKGLTRATQILAKGDYNSEIEELIRLRIVGSQADLDQAHKSINKVFGNVDWKDKSAMDKIKKAFFVGGPMVEWLDTAFKIASYYETLAELDSGTKISNLSTDSNMAALYQMQKELGNKRVAAKIARERYGDSEQASMAAQKASQIYLPFIRFTYLAVNGVANRGLNILRAANEETEVADKFLQGAKTATNLMGRVAVFHIAAIAATEAFNQAMIAAIDDDDEEERVRNLWKTQKKVGTVIVGFDENNNPLTMGFDSMFMTAMRALGLQKSIEALGLKGDENYKPDSENALINLAIKPSGSNSEKVRFDTKTAAMAAKVLNDAMMNSYSLMNPMVQVPYELVSKDRMDYEKMALVPSYSSGYNTNVYNGARVLGLASLTKLQDSEIAETILDFFGKEYMPSYKKQSPVDDLLMSSFGLRKTELNRNVVFQAKQILSDKLKSTPQEFNVSSKDSDNSNNKRLLKEAQSRLFKAVIEGADSDKISRLIEKYKEYGGDKKMMKKYLSNKDIFTGIQDDDKDAVLDYINGNEDASVVNASGNDVYVRDLIDDNQKDIIREAFIIQEETGLDQDRAKEIIGELE
jgi:hypothetical protein